jgi:flavin-binding protein dodecin
MPVKLGSTWRLGALSRPSDARIDLPTDENVNLAEQLPPPTTTFQEQDAPRMRSFRFARGGGTPGNLYAGSGHSQGDQTMSIGKVIEISASSPKSFEDAIRRGIARATETVKDIRGAWIKEQQVRVEDGKIVEFRVDMKVTFIVHDED